MHCIDFIDNFYPVVIQLKYKLYFSDLLFLDLVPKQCNGVLTCIIYVHAITWNMNMTIIQHHAMTTLLFPKEYTYTTKQDKNQLWTAVPRINCKHAMHKTPYHYLKVLRISSHTSNALCQWMHIVRVWVCVCVYSDTAHRCACRSLLPALIIF